MGAMYKVKYSPKKFLEYFHKSNLWQHLLAV